MTRILCFRSISGLGNGATDEAIDEIMRAVMIGAEVEEAKIHGTELV